MPLDPDAETLLAMMRAAGRPPMETLTPDEARQSFRAGRAVVQPDPQDVAEVRDLSCSGPHGAIPLRAYRPIGTKADEVLPALVYYHRRRLAAGRSRLTRRGMPALRERGEVPRGLGRLSDGARI